uniref:(northern house mosquito) hypothetical protein n=1 Tax=Culex pipiens TaxID=7175 RepID=A0A8D8C4U0_CULPI
MASTINLCPGNNEFEGAVLPPSPPERSPQRAGKAGNDRARSSGWTRSRSNRMCKLIRPPRAKGTKRPLHLPHSDDRQATVPVATGRHLIDAARQRAAALPRK